MDVRRILKVYNYVNDDKRPKVNVKFALALGGVLVAAGAVAALFALPSSAPGGAAGPAPADTSRTEYVGLTTDEIAAGALDAGVVQSRWDAWLADHAGAFVEKKEEVRVGTFVAGYKVTYRPA